jgi:preprotein translocase subunit SecA
MLGFIKNIFGNKHEKDVKEYAKLVEATNAFYTEYNGLSHDALRNKTFEFRSRIKAKLENIDADILSLIQKATETEDFIEKEILYNEADALKKQRLKYMEEELKIKP